MPNKRKPKTAQAPFPLLKVMKRLKVSGHQLAKRSHMKKQYIYRIQQLNANPTWRTLMRLLRGLRCSLAEFDPKRN